VVQVPHAVTHQDGGSDEINVEGLSGVLRDLQRGKFSFVGNWADFPDPGEEDRLAFAVDRLTIYRDTGTSWQKVATAHWDYIEGQPSEYFPAPHASTHEEGGEDALTPANLGANWNKLVNKPSTFPPSAHATSHRPGGSDALPTLAPAPITEGASGAEGSSTALARADHVHQTPSEWTPKTHGNEAHSPQALLVDGSAVLQARIRGQTSPRIPSLEWLSVSQDPFRTDSGLIGVFHNTLAFLDKKGGTVVFTPSPSIGSAADLFDGTGTTVRWNNPSGSIVVEIDLPSNITQLLAAGVAFAPDLGARDFIVEYYDTNTGNWETYFSVTDNIEDFYIRRVITGSISASKLRFTFSNFIDASQFRISQLFAYAILEPWYSYVLPIGGGDMYGDIDMNGNDIVNPGLVDGVDVSSHASRHENGGADEINVQGLSGQLADYQKTTWSLVYNKPSTFPPSSHASSHQVGGADEVKPGKYANTVIFSSSSTPPSNYSSLSTGIGARALVLLRIYNGTGAPRGFYFQPGDETVENGDDTTATHALSPIYLEDGRIAHTIMTTDASGNLRWKVSPAYAGVEVRMLAYIKLS